jgi:curved DNA-binding protein
LGEAYRILSDPKKRRQYDTFGSVGGDYAPPPEWGGVRFDFGEHSGFEERDPLREVNIEEVFSDLLGRMSGGSRRGDTRARNIRVEYQRGSDMEVELPLSIEDSFRVSHRQIKIPRLHKTFKIRIPAGLTDGDVIRLIGQGHQAPGGAGPSGDLLVRVRVKPHPRYRLRGRELEVDVNVPDYLAALGGRVEFKAPQGSMSVILPAGIKTGAKLRIPGKGLPKKGGGAGNLLLNVLVSVPDQLTPEQRELYQKLKSSEE